MAIESQRQPSDLRYVGVQEEWEVQWWCGRFGCTPEELRAAVERYGTDPVVIEQKLREAAKVSFTNMGES